MAADAPAFEALADPTRRRILELLRPGERSVGSLVDSLEISQPGISRHLRVLLRAGFVRVRPVGQRRLYSLRRQPFDQLDDWLREYRTLVEARLDRLGALVEPGPAASRSTSTNRRRTQ